MKCKHCGLPRSAHVAAAGGSGRIWLCPNGSGEAYPAVADVKMELHYRAGEDHPWIVSWVHPAAGSGNVSADKPAEALERAGHAIEESLEEKTAEEKAIERAIEER